MELFKRLVNFFMDILETVAFVGSIFIVVYLFLLQPHQVRGASMDDSFHNGQYILTSKISYRLSSPKRGDVVVFVSPKNKDIDFIKRVVGLPGETVVVKQGQIFINNEALSEHYAKTKTETFPGGFLQDETPVTIPQGFYFVLGDNRARSSDSREFGFVPQSAIIGKVFFRYFPPNVVGPIKNPYSQKTTSQLPTLVLRHI